MLTTSGLAATAALVGDPGRAAMLTILMDGRALTATELARAAGITPQTASGHLARMTEAGLLAMQRQGRHRYYRVASAAVARMVESIMSVAAEHAAGRRVAAVFVGPRDTALRRARTCYDHLAGRIAVAMADRLVERGQVELSADGGAVTQRGVTFLQSLGVDLAAASGHVVRPREPRLFCRPCLDWSERRPHLAGTLGAALCNACLANGWMHRTAGSRALTITPAGHLALRDAFNLDAGA